MASARLAVVLLVVVAAAAVQVAAALNTTVSVRNALEGEQEAGVQCARKAGYDERHPLRFNAVYEFDFEPKGDADLYTCAFGFDGLLHWFDLYVGSRDGAVCGDNLHVCRWKILQSGPCFIDSGACFKWDHTSQGS